MILDKNDEKEFYMAIYLSAFGRNNLFFHSNDSITIYNFLCDHFFGDTLKLRIELLSKLLYFDAAVNPQIKESLTQKSKDLIQYVTDIQEQDRPLLYF